MTVGVSSCPASNVIDDVTRAVLAGATITPILQGKVQGALEVLRREADAGNVRRAERVSVSLCTLVQAKRNGRPNLYASQLLRLRKIFGDCVSKT